eukprot:scaffold290614_cov31-Tisochrysis_lutea.AAC.3
MVAQVVYATAQLCAADGLRLTGELVHLIEMRGRQRDYATVCLECLAQDFRGLCKIVDGE